MFESSVSCARKRSRTPCLSNHTSTSVSHSRRTIRSRNSRAYEYTPQRSGTPLEGGPSTRAASGTNLAQSPGHGRAVHNTVAVGVAPSVVTETATGSSTEITIGVGEQYRRTVDLAQKAGGIPSVSGSAVAITEVVEERGVGVGEHSAVHHTGGQSGVELEWRVADRRTGLVGSDVAISIDTFTALSPIVHSSSVQYTPAIEEAQAGRVVPEVIESTVANRRIERVGRTVWNEAAVDFAAVNGSGTPVIPRDTGAAVIGVGNCFVGLINVGAVQLAKPCVRNPVPG